MAGDTPIRTVEPNGTPDGKPTREAAGQLLSRVLLRVGDDLLTIPDALSLRPTGDVVARATDRAITDALTSLDPGLLDGVVASGTNTDITSLSGLTTALSLAQGGTGATEAAGAWAALVLGNVTNLSPAQLAALGWRARTRTRTLLAFSALTAHASTSSPHRPRWCRRRP